MLVTPHDDGCLVVGQPAHGRMCGELSRLWGNETFGTVEPRESVVLAAAEHDDGWVDWELSPTLDPATGLPVTYDAVPLATHLAIHEASQRRLAARDPYAALVVALYRAATVRGEGRLGALRPSGRRIRRFKEGSAALRAGLRSTLGHLDPAELERNVALVRTWDRISLTLLHGRAPVSHAGVPTAGDPVALGVDGGDRVHRVDPWPFATSEVVVGATGRILGTTFRDEQEMQAALVDAPEVRLDYTLTPI